MSSIAVIPARGGSKRIPGKNIRRFHGRPIIGYPIEAARRSGLFERVVVYTDDERIAAVAREHGAEVPFRRGAETADDHAPLARAVIELLERLAERGERHELVCCLLATAPFVDSHLIARGHEAMGDERHDALVTVQASPQPVLRSLGLDPDGHLRMLWPEHRTTRSQDLEPTFHDSGQMYWARTAALIEHGRFLTERARALEIGRLDAIDIDTPADWAAAERLWALERALVAVP